MGHDAPRHAPKTQVTSAGVGGTEWTWTREGDDHHAFHEDAKPGDLSLQFPNRSRSSSNQLVTMITLSCPIQAPRTMTKR